MCVVSVCNSSCYQWLAFLADVLSNVLRSLSYRAVFHHQQHQPERDSSNSFIFIRSLHGDRSAVISYKRRPSSERENNNLAHLSLIKRLLCLPWLNHDKYGASLI